MTSSEEEKKSKNPFESHSRLISHFSIADLRYQIAMETEEAQRASSSRFTTQQIAEKLLLLFAVVCEAKIIN